MARKLFCANVPRVVFECHMFLGSPLFRGKDGYSILFGLLQIVKRESSLRLPVLRLDHNFLYSGHLSRWFFQPTFRRNITKVCPQQAQPARLNNLDLQRGPGQRASPRARTRTLAEADHATAPTPSPRIFRAPSLVHHPACNNKRDVQRMSQLAPGERHGRSPFDPLQTQPTLLASAAMISTTPW